MNCPHGSDPACGVCLLIAKRTAPRSIEALVRLLDLGLNPEQTKAALVLAGTFAEEAIASQLASITRRIDGIPTRLTIVSDYLKAAEEAPIDTPKKQGKRRR